MERLMTTELLRQVRKERRNTPKIKKAKIRGKRKWRKEKRK